MAGDPTLTDHGMYSISGGSLKAVVDGITGINPVTSGGFLYLIPAGEGQINLVEIKYD